jgi:hypothetical protein
MATIIEAPNVFGSDNNPSLNFTIFLAGSIEGGKAENWQKRLSENLNRFDNILILNPRRSHWSDLEVRQLRKQIIWEQEGIKISDLVVFYFDPTTKSPISLMELGQCMGARKKVIVYCPPTFFRYTNVETTMNMSNYTKPHSDYQEFVAEIVSMISRYA